MGLRRTADERELQRIVSAHEKATADLDRFNQEVEKATEQRAEIHAAAAGEYLDESTDFERRRQEVERRIADTELARGRAEAAVEGLKARGVALAERVATANVKRAEKDLAEVEHEHVVSAATRKLHEAETALAQARHEQARPAWQFGKGKSPGDVDAEAVERFARHRSADPRLQPPPRLAERVAKRRAELDREHERALAEREKRRDALRSNPNALLEGDRFPRLGRI